jgi:acetylornithine/succinyldiaminopimelate/putrescine aminotransferase
MIEEGIPERAAKMGRHVMQALGRMRARQPAIREVRGRGLLIGIELDRGAAPVVDACRDAGLLVLTAGDRVVRLAPALIATEADCDRALEILEQALSRVVS